MVTFGENDTVYMFELYLTDLNHIFALNLKKSS